MPAFCKMVVGMEKKNHHLDTAISYHYNTILWLHFTVFILMGLLSDASLLRRKSEFAGTTFEVSENFLPSNGRIFNRSLTEISNFVPLSCNDNLASAPCNSWTAVYGTHSSNLHLLTIPCGHCIIMDYEGAELTLNGGLDIIGKLVFPDNYKLNLIIPLIIVQGELHMTATKPVDGVPNIRFTMIGETTQTFLPHSDNTNVCGLAAPCTAGKKAIVVAGGKVSLMGLPPSTPTWLNLYDVRYGSETFPTHIVLDESIRGKWSVGAEILLTSHTHEWNAQQVNRIVAVSTIIDQPGYLLLELQTPILRPTTVVQSRDFAVEVALLSRNIVFEGGYDTNPQHGGHFWIIQTPKELQSIEGIELVNFGQQGEMGRYPLHFHFCGDLAGSIVSKNSIRRSNQRCIVVHGSDNMIIEENIAFDTKGHCFVLEDGIETGNYFLSNLGALTQVAEKLISNMETDNLPSTFWITNPRNSFKGNVAAGSQGSGYWFELQKRGVRMELYPLLNPKSDPLILFADNIAHSNEDKGIRTYPTGYVPGEIVLFSGLKLYRNNGAGLFLHITRNVNVVGSMIADNKQIGIDIDRADDIRVADTTIIGESDSYRYFVVTQNASTICHFDQFVGIDIHTWKNERYEQGVTLDRINFLGFTKNSCVKTVPLNFDGNTRTKQFDLFTTLNGVRLEEGSKIVNMCEAQSSGVKDIYVTILDGTVFQAPIPQRSVSTIVSNSSNMLNFVKRNQCTTDAETCSLLCTDTCFFSSRLEIEPAMTEHFILKVCRLTAGDNCIFINSGLELEDSTQMNSNRFFLAHLPIGLYSAAFVTSLGTEVWPSFVTTAIDDSSCSTIFLDSSIRLNIPPVTSNECDQLIRNRMMEQLYRGVPAYWLHRFGGIEFLPRAGTNGSNAIASASRDRTSLIGQFLDNRCIQQMQGKFYLISAKIKLIYADDSIYKCDPKTEQCPEVGLYTETGGFSVTETFSASTGVDPQGFHVVQGFMKIDDITAQSDKVFFFIRSNVDNRRLIIDDVSMSHVTDKSRYCKNLILDSSMEGEWQVYWKGIENGQFEAARGFNSLHALRYSNRSSKSDGPSYFGIRNIEMDCLVNDSTWNIVGQMKLVHKITGEGGSCDITRTCPSIRILIHDVFGNPVLKAIKREYNLAQWKSDDFNLFKTVFTVASQEPIGRVIVDITDFPVEFDIIVDNFSILQSV